MIINEFAWMIPLFPLLSFIILIAGRSKWTKELSAFIGIIFAYLSFHLSVYLFVSNFENMRYSWSIPWFEVGGKVIRLGLEIQPLNAIMLIVVSLISFLVQIYSWGYMKKDERFSTYYAYLSLFSFSMLGLVISSNLLQIYIFWELVGVCSFLLIGFWFNRTEVRSAAKKAFIMTRIGDVGFFIAIGLVFWQIGSFELSEFAKAVKAGEIEPTMITLLALLIFLAAISKSGQVPLHTWLPDAMVGPTPVSALIHAATMVAAGVYLVANLFWLFQASPIALDVVAYIGGFTAIFAAVIALVQNDIKKILAFSTVSQLGYMMLGLGSLGYVAGVFHLMTHAFFKSLLFLAAGVIIMNFGKEQDIRKMGGLLGKQWLLGLWFCIACLALTGIPPFSGYFSKEAILISIYANGRIDLLIVALITAFFTALYIFRLYFLVFTGSYRGEKKLGAPLSVMTFPLHILGILTVVIGFIDFPNHWFESFLTTGMDIESISLTGSPDWLPWTTVGISLVGIALASLLYGNKKETSPRSRRRAFSWIYLLLENKFYFDEIYQWLIVFPLKGLGYLFIGFDRFVIGGLVRLTAWIPVTIGGLGSRLQNGQVQTYILISVFGLLLVIVGLTTGGLLK